MKRKTLTSVHIGASITAYTIIISFFLSSLLAEIIADIELIIQVKKYIFYMLFGLICCMPLAGMSGLKLAGRSRNKYVMLKRQRIKLIMANGMILTIFASVLFYRSSHQMIGETFHYLQILELIFGFTNIVMMSLMIRDGRVLSGKIKLQPNTAK